MMYMSLNRVLNCWQIDNVNVHQWRRQVVQVCYIHYYYYYCAVVASQTQSTTTTNVQPTRKRSRVTTPSLDYNSAPPPVKLLRPTQSMYRIRGGPIYPEPASVNEVVCVCV
jgi:hypothetical protein